MIEQIRLRNFRRYRDATLKFSEGVNFIEGMNNVGKTTLFYAIEYGFFGRVEHFKTIRSLASPGKKSIGVELIFRARDGGRYLFQRMHQVPPKAKKTAEGHFTLKQITDDGETYVMASDFNDTEDRLALKLQELTGITRRVFAIALHMRQGDIPAILDGSRQLDIILGVTAAMMAEEELRGIALELEKESASLPVHQERLKAIDQELGQLRTSLSSLHEDRKKTKAQFGAIADPNIARQQLEERLAPVIQAGTIYQAWAQQRDLAVRRLADESERLTALQNATVGLDEQLAQITTATAARAKQTKKLRTEQEKAETDRRGLDAQRGDLTGRIERREQLPKGDNATCEMCGAPIDAAHTARELSAWKKELAGVTKKLDATQTRLTELFSELEKLQSAEREELERSTRLSEQRDSLNAAVSAQAARQEELDQANTTLDAAAAQLKYAADVFDQDQPEEMPVPWDTDGPAEQWPQAVRDGVETIRRQFAEQVGRQAAQRQALTDLLTRFDVQAKTAEKRLAELEREGASTRAGIKGLIVKAKRAERLRSLSVAFKAFQIRVRSESATKLAVDTLGLHRKLAARDEFESLSIDPTFYSLQVCPRDLGEDVPASLYEGGGHRLLLGLAFRLAIARLLEPCPFLLLDEPTYGLDRTHRQTLLNWIAEQDVSKQILLVTHHAMGEVAGHRLRVERSERETVVHTADANSPPLDE